MMPWRWVPPKVVFAIHDRQLAEHGGMDGVRDAGIIESAMVRAVNLAAYGNPDGADLAAAYAFGITKNHGFIDGNKRTAWVVARLFLADNGLKLNFDKHNAIKTMEDLAAGKISEAQLAAWFRRHLGA
jgi:death-on-curing protein